MRTAGHLLLVLASLAVVACDDAPAPTVTTASAAPTVPAAISAPPVQTATAAPTAAATASAAPMPPRPVPIGSSGPIQPSAPPEQQMMVIAYTLAMVAPRGDDPVVIECALDAIVRGDHPSHRTGEVHLVRGLRGGVPAGGHRPG